MKSPAFTLRRLFAGALLGLAASAALAFHPGHDGPPPGMAGMMGPMEGPMGGPGMLPPGMLQQLKLSEEQEDRLFAAMDRHAAELRRLTRALHKAKEALREAGIAEQFDEAKANALAAEMGRNSEALARLRLTIDRETREVLTPAQRQQLRELPPPARGPGHGPKRGDRTPGPACAAHLQNYFQEHASAGTDARVEVGLARLSD